MPTFAFEEGKFRARQAGQAGLRRPGCKGFPGGRVALLYYWDGKAMPASVDTPVGAATTTAGQQQHPVVLTVGLETLCVFLQNLRVTLPEGLPAGKVVTHRASDANGFTCYLVFDAIVGPHRKMMGPA